MEQHDGNVWDVLHIKTHPLTARFIDHSSTCLTHVLEPHACACDGQRCATLTTPRKIVRAARCSVFTLRRVHDIRLMSVREICEKSCVPSKESVDITLSTN